MATQTKAKRSAAAKKAAATRKANQEAAAAEEQQETERQELPAYQPRRKPLQNRDLDQHLAEEKRQMELTEERDAHNTRTGDASRRILH